MCFRISQAANYLYQQQKSSLGSKSEVIRIVTVDITQNKKKIMPWFTHDITIAKQERRRAE